jgi:hypothetical protein
VTAWEPMPQEDWAGVIGEGLHTGLRKGTDAPEAHDLWKAVRDSGRAWSEALEFLVWGLESMGLALCRKADDDPASPALEDLTTDDLLALLPVAQAAVPAADQHVHEVVAVLRSRRVSYADVGKALGVSRQAAWERFSR